MKTGRPPSFSANRFIRVDPQDAYLLERSWRMDQRKHTAYAKGKDEDGTDTYIHRVIMRPPEGMVVDHLNGNGLDNRRSNLQVCSHRGNLLRAQRGAAGVRRAGQRWQAYMGGKVLGSYATRQEALAARVAAWEKACA